MRIYIDLIIFINYIIDFCMLFYLNKMLKRNEKIGKVMLGALFGSLSVLILFIRLSELELFLLKTISAGLMIITTFGFKNIKYFINNLAYLYILGIILGGSLYLAGINTIKSKISSYSLLIILVPIILKTFTKYNEKVKKVNKRYHLDITFKNDKTINLIGFIDTGNKLKDPYFKRPIILIEKKYYEENDENVVLVPYNALNFHGILKCIIPKSVKVVEEKKEVTNVLIGLSDVPFNIDGVNCIINEEIMEEIYV